MFIVTDIYDNIVGKHFDSITCNIENGCISRSWYSKNPVSRFKFEDVSCVVYDTDDGVSEVYNLRTLIELFRKDFEDSFKLYNQFLGIVYNRDISETQTPMGSFLFEVVITVLNKNCVNLSIKYRMCGISVSTDGALEKITDDLIHDTVLVIPNGVTRFKEGLIQNSKCYNGKINK